MRVVNRLGVADIMRGAKQQQVEYVTNGDKKIPKKDDAGNFVLRFEPDEKDKNKMVPVMGTIDKNLPQGLYLIMGKARESKEGTTQYGKYVEYFGVFEAKRLGDGEIFQSGRVIFPPPTDSVVENAFLAAKAEDANAEVGFAFIIGTEEHKHGDEVKFRYTCEPIPLGEAKTVDPLAAIKAAIAEQKPLLLGAPPVAEPSPEPAKPAKGAKATENAEA